MPNWLLYTIAVGCGLLTWRDVKWGLTGIAIAVGISPEYRTELAKDLRLEDFVMVAVFLAWLLQKARDREPLIPVTPLNGLWAAWLVTGGLSVLLGLAQGSLTNAKIGMFHWFKRLELMLLFWMVADRVRSLADVQWLTVSGLVGALLSSFIGWRQKWLNPPREGVHFNAYKVTGPTGEKPNVYAQYLVFNTLVGMALVLSLYPSPAMWLPLWLVSLSVVPVIFSFSRSSIAALGLGVLSLTAVFHRRWLPLMLFAYFLLPILLPSVVQQRLQTISWESFKVERLGCYTAAVRDTVQVNPLTGRGLGFRGFNAYENQYANTFAHEGILGLLAFLALLRGVLRMQFQTLSLTEDPYLRGILQGCIAGTIAYLIAGLSGVPLLAIRPSETFWFWTGLTAGIWRLAWEQALSEVSEEHPSEELTEQLPYR